MTRAARARIWVLAVLGAAAVAVVPPASPATAQNRMAFNPAMLDLAPGETYPVELYFPSPTGGVVQNATLRYQPAERLSVEPDDRWGGRIPRAGVKTYPKVTAARTAWGTLPVKAQVGPNGPDATLQVRMVRPAVAVIPGQNRLTVRLTNPFRTRLLFGRVQAANPDRFLQNVTAREFRIEAGKSGEVVFPLPGAAPVEGEAYDFTLTVETYQGYREARTYSIVFPSQPEKEPLR